MSFPAYPAYKDSGVEWLGSVPAHWVLTPIKHLALLNPRKSDFAGDVEQLCSFVPMEKLKTGVVQLDEERPIAEVIGGYTYFEDGDVLQAKVTPCFENKNVAIAKGLTNGIGFGSSEINVLRPYQGVNAEYLYYRVQEDSYMSFCTSSMIGAGGLKRVPTDVINNFKIAAPKLGEQTQIARFLDHETARIDALIEEQQRLIELLKEKRQAVISHAVTKGLDPTVPMKDSGVEWLGEVPAHWSVHQLKRAIAMIESGTSVNAADYPAETGSLGVLKTSCVYTGAFDWRENKTVDQEDLGRVSCPLIENTLIVSRMNTPDLVGATGLVSEAPEGIFLPDRLWQVYIEQDHFPSFIFYFTKSPEYREQVKVACSGTSSSMQNLGQDDFRSLLFVQPPLLEQIEIASFLDGETRKLDLLIEEAAAGVVLLNERRSALISAAVTGKIDVRGWQPPASSQTPESAVAEAV